MGINKIEVWFPTLLMLSIIATTGYLTYGFAQGPWYRVIYLGSNADAFQQSSPYVDAIVENDGRSAVVYKENSNITALENSGAIIIDSKEVPLCLTSPY